ncbi:uncharacterized protein MKZ38_008199 [Zalerion maritima]|uniref:Phospholipase n=1 Tax=Zalerion maritima TaxID=339359 RepID=A0AAD5WNT2_9PEZI|nr:uncharacterized protein MKZ38_008199 [Zalerion maritima]
MDFFKKMGDKVGEHLGEQLGQLNLGGGRINAVFGGEAHSHTHIGHDCSTKHPEEQTNNRYCSFVPQSTGHAKWYVDGASYFWAMSTAIEEARETIYILDWWLSPELYLRRPPSSNNNYRLDNLLKAAAERGVKIKVIVYKEVEAVLSLKSVHTKHHLEDLHPNIGVFRHPDHAPSGYDLQSEFTQSFSNLKTFDLAKASGDALSALYGTSEDIVLFWAHHEKLCLIDNKIAFTGGLDACKIPPFVWESLGFRSCFGRWDTNSHPIADAHPGNLDAIVFPGQDFNNARVYDFDGVDRWEQNKLDRKENSRMGWSDIALSLSGPIVQSLMTHFVDRWNFIHREKYKSKDGDKYAMLTASGRETGNEEEAPTNEEGEEGGMFGGFDHLQRRLHHGINRMVGGEEEHGHGGVPRGNDLQIQLTRSCCEWSGGHHTEHSIANAYLDAIGKAEHFIYIENQFFITATSSKQDPVMNKLGLAMVERIVRAHEEGQDFKIIVIMPAVPAFAGDLQSDDALGTRAIMEFQYNSINRGGYSIMEALRDRGVDDINRYIAFYNLRNYDRLNISSEMGRVERDASVDYETARREHDDYYEGDGGSGGYGGTGNYERYQEAARRQRDDSWDSVCACYMENGPDIASIPWNGSEEAEMKAFVSEELYIHSKVLIADDRLVICGSANLNDRSQLGDHDSEIAVVIEDPEADLIDSSMNGEPYRVGRFATSLRRFLFRKHLGLVPHQPCDAPDNNWTPVHHGLNEYDWGSRADRAVEDPMSREFRDLWAGTAKTNTEVFSKVFHNVPNDHVRTWDDYDEFFTKKFKIPGAEKKNKKGENDGGEAEEVEEAGHDEGKVLYGHVVPDEFPGGVREVKEWLGRVRGTLVEMPLQFLIDVDDLAKEGMSFNRFTDEIYT